MDTIVKWQLKQKLSYNEMLEVLKELYGGAKKKFIFESNKEINQHLYQIYSDFVSADDSNVIINFSDNITKKPFISNKQNDEIKASHTIYYDNGEIYIYE